MYKPLEFKDFCKKSPSRLAQMIDNPYRNFAASKMRKSAMNRMVVEYTDIFGEKHIIPVRSRRKMAEVQLFLSIYKKEAATVKAIIAEYPMSYGRVPKKFMSQLTNELKAVGLTKEQAVKLAGY